MDITAIVLQFPAIIAAIIALFVAVSNWRRLPVEIDRQKTELKAQEVTLSEKIQGLMEKEIEYMRVRYEQKIKDLEDDYKCQIEMLTEKYEFKIEKMQARITELEAEIAKLKNGAAVVK